MTLHLLPDWRSAWRWSSVRILAVGGVVQISILAFPAQLAQYVPQWMLGFLATFALVCTVAAGLGRITTTEKHDVP